MYDIPNLYPVTLEVLKTKYLRAYATTEEYDQPEPLCSLISVFLVCMNNQWIMVKGENF